MVSRNRGNIQSNTPEDLLDGSRKGSGGILSFCSGQTDQLSSTERKRSGDKDRAETLEAVAECARVVPGARTPVFIVLTTRRATAADENQRNKHEDNDGSELEARGPKLFFRVTHGAEYVDHDDGNQEHSDPDRDADVDSPIIDCKTGDCQFERYDDSPLEDVVPAHGKAPGGINKTGRECIEATRDRVHNSEFTKSVDWAVSEAYGSLRSTYPC